jgi:5'-methylthioadenosine phosphorylase
MSKIGIIGGTGLYSFLDNVEEKKIETPYGDPSAELSIGTYQDKEIVFLPRHGKTHQFPPHKINYKANMWAMQSLGVKHIIAPTAAGSLRKDIHPGDFVVVDQFIDRTKDRDATYYDGPVITHMPGVEPYCTCLRDIANNVMEAEKAPYHSTGTVVIIEGPRFSTKAESKWFTSMGGDVINMTQYPEAPLARELEMCYVNISLITDYDSGFDGERPSVTVEDAIKAFKENTGTLKNLIIKMVEKVDLKTECSCHSALKTAQF